MALSREEFEAAGGAFSVEDARYPSDPDQPYFEANLTYANRTATLAGKSEEEVLAQAERILSASAPERLA